MKKFMSLLIMFQIIFMNSAAIKAAEVEQDVSLDNSEPIKLCCHDSGGGLSAGAITAITVGGVGGAIALAAVARKMAEKNKFATINRFDVSSIFHTSEIQTYLPKYEVQYKLLPAALRSSAKLASGYNFQLSDIIPVAFGSQNGASADTRIIVLGDSELMDKTLHGYSVKFPQDMIMHGEKLLIDATFVFDAPNSVKLNKSAKNIDIRLFDDIGMDKIAKIISNKNYSLMHEYKGSLKLNKINKFEDNAERNLYIVEKEFKLSNSEAQKPFLIAVSSLKNLKESDQDYVDNYAVVLKIRKAD